MIEFKDVTKEYEDGFKALDNISLKVRAGELLVLIGPSGCGKTTTMKMINRLIEPTSGEISVNGKPIKNRDPVELRRDTGYVIQQIGLLPHMTIGENVALVPRLKKGNKEEYLKKVDELLEMVDLDPVIYKDRYPNELSGGQQQRVGVIRALAADPSIMLMDEPFSALDPISREQLQDEFSRLHKQIKKTIVFVTHDMDEALKIADRIAIMKEGKIVQTDTPERILRYPINDFVRDFIGEDRLSGADNEIHFPPLNEFVTRAVTISESRGLAQSNKRLNKYRVDSLIVVDNDKKFLGVASSWDIGKNYKNEDMVVRDIINLDYASIRADESSEKALTLMRETGRGYVVVVDEKDRVQGVVTNGNLVKLLASEIAD